LPSSGSGRAPIRSTCSRAGRALSSPRASSGEQPSTQAAWKASSVSMLAERIGGLVSGSLSCLGHSSELVTTADACSVVVAMEARSPCVPSFVEPPLMDGTKPHATSVRPLARVVASEPPRAWVHGSEKPGAQAIAPTNWMLIKASWAGPTSTTRGMPSTRTATPPTRGMLTRSRRGRHRWLRR
jgi:hypothetical protein